MLNPPTQSYPVAFINRKKLGYIKRTLLQIGTDTERIAIVRKAFEDGAFDLFHLPGNNAQDALNRAFSVGYSVLPGDIVFDPAADTAFIYNHRGQFTPARIRYTSVKE